MTIRLLVLYRSHEFGCHCWLVQQCFGFTASLTRRSGYDKALVLGLLLTLAATTHAEEPRPLLQPGEQSVTFKLQDAKGKIPQLLLFREPDEKDTADSINYWRGTPNSKEQGVVVEFKAIRFLRCDDDADKLIVRLVGIKNELELGSHVALEQLESGKQQEFHFGPVTLGAPGLIAGTTDAEMLLSYDPEHRRVTIPKVSGTFAWKRFLYDPQEDAGSLTDVTGKVGDVPAGEEILKAPEE